MINHRRAEWPWRGRVVHLALPLDERVFEVLAPATSALARCGQTQSLVLIDDARNQALLGRLDDAVSLVRVPAQHNPLLQWRAVSEAFAALFDGAPPSAVHMYGDTARRLGERVLRDLGARVPRFHSPAGGGVDHVLWPLAMVGRLLGRHRSAHTGTRDIVIGAATAGAGQGAASRALTVLEGPVHDAYFGALPPAARYPLIVSASRSSDADAATRFDQLAVLLGGEGLGLAFHWIGPVDEVSALRLRAASVGVFDPHDDGERAARLAAAWVFVALAESRGFPLCLAEAMAAGVPCVAMDNPAHRSLVRHGETGYLCRKQSEVIGRIAQLADSPDLRGRMGRNGRELAQARFGEGVFKDTLMAAYAAPVPAAAAARARPATQPWPVSMDRP